MKADVIIVGGHLAGLSLAVSLQKAGLQAIVLEKQAARADDRTTALWKGSVEFLEGLGIWEKCREAATPIERLKITDGPAEVLFDSEEIEEHQFGYNVPNEVLKQALLDEVENFLAPVTITKIESGTVHLDDGQTLSAQLIVGADGQKSFCRQQAGINVKEWTYPHKGIVCTVAHEKPHDNTSFEFYSAAGPFALVPLQGNKSSIVWVEESDTADEILKLSDKEFNETLMKKSQGILGDLTVCSPRGAWPLSAFLANTYISDRLVLIAEAAHRLHPITAQGLNLSLRDVRTLSKLLIKAHQKGQDLGAPALLKRYELKRKPDTISRVLGVHGLNRLVSNDISVVGGLRQFGLQSLNHVKPLRRLALKQGIA